MAGVNRWYGVGNMTADPELKRGDNSERCLFSIAVNRPGQDSEPTYIDLIAWDKLASQVAEFGSKGRLVFCEGELEVRKWEDRETGERKRAYRIKAYVVRFLDSRRDRERDDDDRRDDRRPSNNSNDFDDLPF